MLCKHIGKNIDIIILSSVFVDLGSFQVVGMATNGLKTTTSNENRPVLIQPVHRSSSSSKQKLLQIEFETNPLDKSGDYRVKVVAQSMEAKYNAVRGFPSKNLQIALSLYLVAND